MQNYKHLIIPVHLPTEKHQLLAIISIINLCIYINDSATIPENTYQSIFQTLKQKFIKKERQTVPPQQCTLLHRDNWQEKTPSCPKHFGIDKKKSGDHFRVRIISGSGSFWGLYRSHSFIHVTGVGSESPFAVNESCKIVDDTVVLFVFPTT